MPPRHAEDPPLRHARSAWLPSVIGVLAICAAGPGCALVGSTAHNVCAEIQDRKDRKRELTLYRQWADEALGTCLHAHTDQPVSVDFAEGFRDGFVDHVRTGTSLPPLLPPPRYYRPEYESVPGKQAIQDWFAGYRQGIDTAAAGGYRHLVTLPSSLRPPVPPTPLGPALPAGGLIPAPVTAPAGGQPPPAIDGPAGDPASPADLPRPRPVPSADPGTGPAAPRAAVSQPMATAPNHLADEWRAGRGTTPWASPPDGAGASAAARGGAVAPAPSAAPVPLASAWAGDTVDSPGLEQAPGGIVPRLRSWVNRPPGGR